MTNVFTAIGLNRSFRRTGSTPGTCQRKTRIKTIDVIAGNYVSQDEQPKKHESTPSLASVPRKAQMQYQSVRCK
jgi:hypothetical protein